MPPRYAKALRRYRFGPGVAKVDFVLSGEIPWRDERVWRRRRRCTWAAPARRWRWPRREIAAGRHAEWPMVLAALPHLADPARIDAQGRRPLWTYAHVPAGSTVDLAETVTGMFERFAPGFRDVVVAARSVPAAQMADHNANLVGGDIGVGGNNTVQRADRPDAAAQPVDHADPEGLPVLVGHAAGQRGARHGRLLRRAHGAAPRVRHQEAAAPVPLTRDFGALNRR